MYLKTIAARLSLWLRSGCNSARYLTLSDIMRMPDGPQSFLVAAEYAILNNFVACAVTKLRPLDVVVEISLFFVNNAVWPVYLEISKMHSVTSSFFDPIRQFYCALESRIPDFVFFSFLFVPVTVQISALLRYNVRRTIDIFLWKTCVKSKRLIFIVWTRCSRRDFVVFR
ncbi:hypothetical protein V1478_018167 [Vespula squamosa]|uniref:Uncharacterized protein n=1 Tax=Vespula squamosa TaxID=30214 RepID=A0ABD1ZWB3_VESSQ